jgi:hypothetical protein
MPTEAHPTFSLAAVLRHRLALATEHADTVPLHHLRVELPPGAAIEPELRRVADEFNAALHRAGKAAVRARSHDEHRSAFLEAVKPILAEHAEKAGAIESRRRG